MALKKKITDEYGIATMYHKISRIDCDYNKNQIHIYVENYSSDKYRNLEKKEYNQIKEEKEKILSNKDITNEEKILELQEIESKNIIHRAINQTKYTLDFKEDIRGKIYSRIKDEIKDYKEAKEV